MEKTFYMTEVGNTTVVHINYLHRAEAVEPQTDGTHQEPQKPLVTSARGGHGAGRDDSPLLGRERGRLRTPIDDMSEEMRP